MTVSELIERLKACDPNAVVVVLDYTGCLASAASVSQAYRHYNAGHIDDDCGPTVEISAEIPRSVK